MNARRIRAVWPLLGAVLLLPMCGCLDDGDEGVAGDPGAAAQPPPTDTVLDPYKSLPGVVLSIIDVAGASGADGTFQAGDTIRVKFTVKKSDGTALPVSELDSTSIYVSGPTFNYQRVIPAASNWHTSTASNSDGSYTYTFASAIPATYAAPYNDTNTFGANDGELQGQPLLAGTYTIGMQAYKYYTVEGVNYRDVGNVTKDFLFGGATTLEPREAVKLENCNQCHVTLQMHGGTRRDTKLCVLCHTAGAEDRNVASAAGGTPDVTIEFKVMIHKIHNGLHLPSVLGVATNPNGTRDYAATPKPYKIVGYNNSIHDYSGVGFPVWPNLNVAMPRDQGHVPSTPEASLEDEIRRGVTDCAKCHGDPDGDGPLTAPAQGDLAYAQPSRRACGACHDDIDWSHPYISNGQTMPSQANDSACVLCHVSTTNGLDTVNAHLHPLKNAALNPGLNVDMTAATPSVGTSLDPGEKLAVTFSIKDDTGTDVQPSGIGLNVVVAGPTTNRNLLLYTSIPTDALGAIAPSYTLNVPERVALEGLGLATGGVDVFTTARAPHWNFTGDLTSILEGTFTGTVTTLAAASTVFQNYVDAVSSTGFANNDYIVIDRGLGTQEYLRVRRVEGNRLWFSTRYDSSVSYQPYLRMAHASGAGVEKVTVATKVEGTQWSCNHTTGEVTLVAGQFTAGKAVISSYTTDFVMPSVFPPPLNDSPDLDETWGEWAGKAITSGTYTVGVWGSYTWTYNAFDDGVANHNNSYRTTSLPSNKDFLVGSATTLAPYSLIDVSASGGRCNECHNEILFHGGSRRNVETCLLCHGTAGSEDWPIYRSPVPANATPGVTINFRTMLHKIHMGEELANASTYTVNGFNGGGHTYEEVVFPAMPGAVKHCDKCHGSSAAWKAPADRNHPTEQFSPVRAWNAACGSCHDSSAAQAHIGLQTFSGSESCAVCHGPGREFNVELMHKNR